MKQKLLQTLAWPLRTGVKWYLSKPRTFTYKGTVINVQPGVFHPGFFFSTRLLLQYLDTVSLDGVKFLELGAGSGIISIRAAKRGARVTASDINTIAVGNIRENARANDVVIDVVHSDLFDKIDSGFDWIVINPPYYPANPKKEAEYAWYCGEAHEYFEKLFATLGKVIHPESKILMILSDVCDLEKIFAIAAKHNFSFEKILEKNVWADGRNYLYFITHSNPLPQADVQ